MRVSPRILAAAALAAVIPSAHSAVLESATLLTPQPERFAKVEYVVIGKASFKDPYRSADVRLDLSLTSPSGRKVVVPGYFDRGPSDQSSVWRVRFAPEEAGKFSGILVFKDATGASELPLTFDVGDSNRRGFLRTRDSWTFAFDNGEPFRGIGQNICWEARTTDDNAFFGRLHENERFNYEYMLGQLQASGGNFYRTWMCAWNLPLGWKKVIDTNRYREDTTSLNRSAMDRMDELVELNEQLGLYCMLVLDHAGGYVGGQWELNPMSAKQGGPCATPEEFFTLPAAREAFRDRVRYLVARWGYSPSLAVWEFWNEIDNVSYGQKTQIPDAVITAWHKEMSEYLKELDPQKRLVSTSISHRDIEGMNRITAMDFNQRHIYGHTDEMGETIRKYSLQDGKPYVIGEFAFEWDWTKNFSVIADKLDADYKRGLWKGLFAPTPILPLSWWWEFFDDRKLTGYLGRVRVVQDEMLASGKGSFADVDVSFSATGVSAQAVKCGPKTFVLLSNRVAASVTGEVKLAGRPSLVGEVYDPESGSRSALASTTVTVPSGADLILVFNAR
ncbi:MAG: DUF5060 domain-containing protein [Opitutaceae bacterium]|nr:DUF5060 domain-containing protein [Opitutaceae bacterium]